MSETDVLKAQEKLGQDVVAFIQSDIGRYLDGTLKQDEDQAKSELLELDPLKFTTLVDLQNAIVQIQLKVKIAQSIHDKLEEAINTGRDATHQLENQE